MRIFGIQMEISKLLVKLIYVLQHISGDVAQKVASQSEKFVCFDPHFFSVQLNGGARLSKAWESARIQLKKIVLSRLSNARYF